MLKTFCSRISILVTSHKLLVISLAKALSPRVHCAFGNVLSLIIMMSDGSCQPRSFLILFFVLQLGSDPWGGESDHPGSLRLRHQLEAFQNSPWNLRRRGTCVLQVQVDIFPR